jgi:hypothetical protein
MGKIRKGIMLFIKPFAVFGGVIMMAYSYITPFIGIPPITQDWRLGLVFGLILFIIGMFCYVFDLYRQYVWWAKPEIEILYFKKDFFNHGDFGLIAQLEIKNKEEIEITDCYATLETASDIYRNNDSWGEMPLIPSMSNGPDRILWVEKEYSNGLCEITIPPNDSRHIFLADTSGDFHYNLRLGSLSPYWMIGPVAHTVRIRIDGKFNGKSMKPLYFDGYMCYELKLADYTASDTRNGEYIGEVKGTTAYPHILFEKGSWMKNKDIRKSLGIDEGKKNKGKKEVFAKECFPKAPKKVTKSISPKTSYGKGKKKH